MSWWGFVVVVVVICLFKVYFNFLCMSVRLYVCPMKAVPLEAVRGYYILESVSHCVGAKNQTLVL